jgi:hypothetical protein
MRWAHGLFRCNHTPATDPLIVPGERLDELPEGTRAASGFVLTGGYPGGGGVGWGAAWK